jgi:alpha-galactosidase/6-phospho-beta-glucosidase family protein
VSETDRRTLVLIGAGSAVFTRGLLADLISATDLGSWDLRLVDVDEVALGVAVRLAGRSWLEPISSSLASASAVETAGYATTRYAWITVSSSRSGTPSCLAVSAACCELFQ